MHIFFLHVILKSFILIGKLFYITVPDYGGYLPSQMRKKREATQNSTTVAPVGNKFIPTQANFSLVVFTTGCRSWNHSQNAWSSEGCLVRIFDESVYKILIFDFKRICNFSLHVCYLFCRCLK